MNYIEDATAQFKAILTDQLKRIDNLQKSNDWVNYAEKKTITIGICWGDGIGESISKQAQRVLEHVLSNDIAKNKIKLTIIDGLTIDHRAAVKKAIPDDVLKQLKQCDVILKGPTTTPQEGDGWPNIESANVAMRRELDLFACVRPIRIPEKSIDWIFFRENTEGSYALGSKGIDVGNDMSIDFNVTTAYGSERIIRMAFDYAKANNKKRVTLVTKSNVIKACDGRFSRIGFEIAKEYKKYDIHCDEWYIDIMTAKLLDPNRAHEFEVMTMPNLYGDILTDEAGQIQGGVGTAGSANIGKQYAMFEAIHGSAPRMVTDGRAQYADPSSMIKATAMLLQHIGYKKEATAIETALLIATQYEKKHIITGRDSGVTGEKFTNYVMEWIDRPNLMDAYQSYVVQ